MANIAVKKAFYFARSVARRFGVELVPRVGPHFFSADGLSVTHNVSFYKDERFARAYSAGVETKSWGAFDVRWRAFVACWVAEQCSRLPGDFVECGVNRGGLSSAIIEFVRFDRLNKRFFLLDTFNGLDLDLLSPSEKAKWATLNEVYPDCYQDVVNRFSKFSFVKIIRGRVPDTLPEVDTERVAFISIDMNCVAPEIAAAEHFWSKLVPGGMILLDDYGFAGYEEQHDAFNQFAQRVGVTLLALPTGQGLLQKPFERALA